MGSKRNTHDGTSFRSTFLKNPYECYYEGVYGNFMLGFELASKGGVLCFH